MAHVGGRRTIEALKRAVAQAVEEQPVPSAEIRYAPALEAAIASLSPTLGAARDSVAHIDGAVTFGAFLRGLRRGLH